MVRPTHSKRLLNIVVLGASRVGKTCLISQLTESCLPPFYQSIPKAVSKKSIVHNAREYICVITDTASHATSTLLLPQFIIGTHVFILVYSVACQESFEIVSLMHEKILDFCGENTVPMVIVGNKQDIITERVVSTHEGLSLANRLGCAFVETTSYSYQSIHTTLEICIDRIEGGVPRRTPSDSSDSTTFLSTLQKLWIRTSVELKPSLAFSWLPTLKISQIFPLTYPDLHIGDSLSQVSWLQDPPPFTPQSSKRPDALPIAASPRPQGLTQFEDSATLRPSAPVLEEVWSRHRTSVQAEFSQQTLVSTFAAPKLHFKTRAPSIKQDLISNSNGFVQALRLLFTQFPTYMSGNESSGKTNAHLMSVYRDLAEDFLAIFEDRATSRVLLAMEGDQAQIVLDVLQMILDSEQLFLTRADRARILQLLLKLAKESGLYPRCLLLSDIARQDALPVAAGHFGEIWLGRFQRRSVCIKAIRMYQRSDANRLFKIFAREAILWSHLNHANVLPFYGIYRLDDDAGRICLVSPWMENGSLRDYLIRVPSANRYVLAHDVSQGLLYLHNQGIVHGDLKSVNILVTRSGRACLADFGLSSLAESEFNSSGSSLHMGGTTRWQAPELFDPTQDDAKHTKLSDIYSLGCVLYEIFTGKIPFYEVPREWTVISQVQAGRKPSKPSADSASFREWGLSEAIWTSCIEGCWSSVPTERPTIPYVLLQLAPYMRAGALRSRRTSSSDSASKDGWLTPADVRNAIRRDVVAAERSKSQRNEEVYGEGSSPSESPPVSESFIEWLTNASRIR